MDRADGSGQIPDCECVRMMRRAGRFRVVLTTWLEQQIEDLVDLPEDFLNQAESPEAIRQERMRRFREAAFSLHIEEHFGCTKRDRDHKLFIRCCVVKVVHALKSCLWRFAKAKWILHLQPFAFPKALKVLKAVRIGPISPDAGHPELRDRLAKANEGDLIGPFEIGDVHVLLRLDTRITTRLDEALQGQLLNELYDAWLDRQLCLLEVGDAIEPPEYIPAL